MGITHFFIISDQFSMLFNGKFAFYQFPILFNRNLRLEKLGGGWTDRLMDGRMYGNSPLSPTGHQLSGAAVQKAFETLDFPLFDSCSRTDQRSNEVTD